MIYTTDKVKEMLANNDQWVERALIAVYKRQTEDEKIAEATKVLNLKGFTGADAKIMTSMAIYAIKKRKAFERDKIAIAPGASVLTPKQIAYLRRGKSDRFPSRIGKYAGQLVKIIEGKIA